MADNTPTLPNTAYAVLGLLSAGEPLSGYDVRQSAEALRHFYWRPAQSQIYAELRRLAGLVYVTSAYVPQEGKPNKRLYTITAAGLAAFRAWVNDAPLEPTVIKHPLQLRLFFGSTADPKRLAAHLARYIAEGEAALGQIAIVREYAELDPAYRWQGIVAAWSAARLEAEVAFARDLLQQMEAATG